MNARARSRDSAGSTTGEVLSCARAGSADEVTSSTAHIQATKPARLSSRMSHPSTPIGNDRTWTRCYHHARLSGGVSHSALGKQDQVPLAVLERGVFAPLLLLRWLDELDALGPQVVVSRLHVVRDQRQTGMPVGLDRP